MIYVMFYWYHLNQARNRTLPPPPRYCPDPYRATLFSVDPLCPQKYFIIIPFQLHSRSVHSGTGRDNLHINFTSYKHFGLVDIHYKGMDGVQQQTQSGKIRELLSLYIYWLIFLIL